MFIHNLSRRCLAWPGHTSYTKYVVWLAGRLMRTRTIIDPDWINTKVRNIKRIILLHPESPLGSFPFITPEVQQLPSTNPHPYSYFSVVAKAAQRRSKCVLIQGLNPLDIVDICPPSVVHQIGFSFCICQRLC